jgi:hypothetical protein
MKNDSRAFVNQVMLLVLLTFCGGGAVGLGTVWMRHRASRAAEHNRVLEANIQRVTRQITETTVLVASAQSPAELRLRNSEFRLGLDRILEAQVLHDTREAGERLLAMRARSNRELLQDVRAPDAPAPTPGLITFKIAQRN